MLTLASNRELRRVDNLDVAQHTLDAMLQQAPSTDGFVINLNRLGLAGQESVAEAFDPTLASHGFYPADTESKAFLEPVAPEAAMIDTHTLRMILFTGGTAIGRTLRTKPPFYDDSGRVLKHLNAEIGVRMLNSSFFFSQMLSCLADEGDLLVCPPERVVHLQGHTFPLAFRILTSVKGSSRPEAG